MFGIRRRYKRTVRDRTVYLEIFGDNKVMYRVTAGRMSMFGEEISTYGVEAEDSRTGEIETIADFSHNLEDAVDFAESLISERIPPRLIYSKALSYLYVCI